MKMRSVLIWEQPKHSFEAVDKLKRPARDSGQGLLIKQSSSPGGLWLMMCLRMQYFKQLLL
jgi:hypothetical protein